MADAKTCYIRHYRSPLGGITLAADGSALTGLWFDGQTHFGTTILPGAQEAPLPVFMQAVHWLDCYFQGSIPDFMPPIHLDATPFRRQVWEILCAIPYGETMTYGEIAQMIAAQKGKSGMSAQAVGNAVGYNPISIIVPCHRVVGAAGRLTGYAGGLKRKEALLALEQANCPGMQGR